MKQEKQNLIQEDKKDSTDQIDHYKSQMFFLDEAELMVEASLLPKLLDLKKFIDQINENYHIELAENVKLSTVDQPKKIQEKRKQFYINILEIKPIKMTISINFESAEAHQNSALINMLTWIPAGV